MGVKSSIIIVITIAFCCFLSNAAGQKFPNMDDSLQGLDNLGVDKGALTSALSPRKVIEMYL
ncbi:hypothetical protein NPIL_675131, partial [Nephila pilipes]